MPSITAVSAASQFGVQPIAAAVAVAATAAIAVAAAATVTVAAARTTAATQPAAAAFAVAAAAAACQPAAHWYVALLPRRHSHVLRRGRHSGRHRARQVVLPGCHLWHLEHPVVEHFHYRVDACQLHLYHDGHAHLAAHTG